MKIIIVSLLILGSVAAGATYYVLHVAAEPPANFRTTAVKKGDLLSTIGATGTVEPEEVVDVGAQVQGRVLSLGMHTTQGGEETAKRIDYGSVVDDGTILALIDDAVYKAQRDQAHAAVNHAEADLLQAKAKVEQTAAKVDQTEAEWSRAQRLRPDLVKPEEHDATVAKPAPEPDPEKPLRRTISDADFVLAKANFRSAEADKRAAEANVELARAAIEQSQATLTMAETNLSYTVIKSPVKGVIVDRRVNIGQTVVASLNAPSLFLIAKDLSRIQVWASVNEADIGRIRKDMPVRFTVDAYPGETFRGTVAQIRPERHHDPERRDLHRGGRDGQCRSSAPALFDGQSAVRGRGIQERLAGAQCGPALETATRPSWWPKSARRWPRRRQPKPGAEAVVALAAVPIGEVAARTPRPRRQAQRRQPGRRASRKRPEKIAGDCGSRTGTSSGRSRCRSGPPTG